MTRRHDLDWLRVLLFALLVPHHVAVGFVDWGVDIYGFVNDRLAGEGLGLFIYWSHSWRLPSLFLIAGVGTWFLTRRGTGPRFMAQRLVRLLVPLVFGTVCLTVLSGYAIARMGGDGRGFAAFWWDWVATPEPRQVQHLWFLINLAVYTLLLWPLFLFRTRLSRWQPLPAVLLAGLFALSAGAVVAVKPHAAAIAGDGYQFGYYLVFFLGGALVGAGHEAVLGWAGRWVWPLLAGAVALFTVKVILLGVALEANIAEGEALARGGWVPLGLEPRNGALFSVVEAATAWAWCLAALGGAARILNRSSPLLSSLSRGVYPLYVLHFPITIVGLALAAQVPAPWWLEALVLTVAVFLLSWTVWRILDRMGPLGILVGGRPSQGA